MERENFLNAGAYVRKGRWPSLWRRCMCRVFPHAKWRTSSRRCVDWRSVLLSYPLFHRHQDKVVEFLADFLPEGHVLVEQCDVIFVVVANFQVQEFVQYHVIQTADGRMRQMQIEPEFQRSIERKNPLKDSMLAAWTFIIKNPMQKLVNTIPLGK